MTRRRITRPQNLGQNRNVQMRNNARRPGTFQSGVSLNKQATPQSCPTGQQPKMVNGKMTCVPAIENAPVVPKPKSGNRGY